MSVLNPILQAAARLLRHNMNQDENLFIVIFQCLVTVV
jgi:hypothetical protein